EKDQKMISRRIVVCGISAAAVCGTRPLLGQTCNRTASYEGRLLLEPQSDGRYMRIDQSISYHDACGTSWPVPAGAIVDGASIPWPLWSVLGGPFEGAYRNASVIHD